MATVPATTQQATKPPISIGGRGMQLQNLDDAWRFAQCLSVSGLAPKGLDKPEQIVVALQMGFEIGLTPMAAIQNIAVINGRPMVWGDAPLAVCRASGLFDESKFTEKLKSDGKVLSAECTVCRKGGNPVTRSFSMADADAAGLVAKGGPWKQYPKRMLQMRARSWALRDAFTDVLRGVHIREEAEGDPAMQQYLAPPNQEAIAVEFASVESPTVATNEPNADPIERESGAEAAPAEETLFTDERSAPDDAGPGPEAAYYDALPGCETQFEIDSLVAQARQAAADGTLTAKNVTDIEAAAKRRSRETKRK